MPLRREVGLDPGDIVLHGAFDLFFSIPSQEIALGNVSEMTYFVLSGTQGHNSANHQLCGWQVHAEHEEKSDAGDMTRRLYVRQYSLPKGIDVEHVRPSLTNDGVLTVEAPATSLSPTERLIPIEYKGHMDASTSP